MHLGLDTVPVEFCTPARVTPTREQVEQVIEREVDLALSSSLVLADAILALMAGLAEEDS